MKATEPMIVDGHKYNVGDEIPDLGSLVCTTTDGTRRNYEGLEADAEKLPTYDDLGTGSSFLASDTGMFAKYEATTKTWYEL